MSLSREKLIELIDSAVDQGRILERYEHPSMRPLSENNFRTYDSARHAIKIIRDKVFALIAQELQGEGELAKAVRESEPVAVAWMFPSDLERFENEETFAQAYSVSVGNPSETTVPLYLYAATQPADKAIQEGKS